MMPSMVAPASIFSKIAATGIRVPRSTHAPLTLPGVLSTAGHCDQSRFAIGGSPGFRIAPARSEHKKTTRGKDPCCLVGTTSGVAFRDGSALARFELGQPGIGFLGREVQAGSLIFGPCGKRVPPELLALLLAFDIPLDGFAPRPHIPFGQSCFLERLSRFQQ